MIKLKISNINVFEDITDDELLTKVCKKNKINKSQVTSWYITKKSIDARDKSNVHYNYSVEILCSDEERNLNEENLLKVENIKKFDKSPIVIGAGPAGLFAAYTLALNGAKPILVEQGKKVEDRQKDVDDFINNGKLIPTSNVQFGEGGAGTFSDGKLTTGVNNVLNKTVLETFVKFGAPNQILYLNKPHMGTDNLVKIVRNMREEIIRLGGKVLFETKVIGFEYDDTTYNFESKKDDILNKSLKAVILSNGEKIETNNVILAVGHSARDTFETLYKDGAQMEPKAFSVGVRIEH